jgi:hypothetical protein
MLKINYLTDIEQWRGGFVIASRVTETSFQHCHTYGETQTIHLE